jgi:hypothetical protein
MTFVEIEDGYWIVAESVIAVKKIDDNSCSLWLCGQQAEHGFVVKRKAKDLLEEICTACNDDEGPEADVDEDQNET